MKGMVGTERGETQRLVRAAVRISAQDERHGTGQDGGLGKGQDRAEGSARGQNMMRSRSSGRVGRTVEHRRSAKQSEGHGPGQEGRQGLRTGQGRAGQGRTGQGRVG